MIWETWNYNSYVENQLTLQLSIVQKYHLIHSTALQSLFKNKNTWIYHSFYQVSSWSDVDSWTSRFVDIPGGQLQSCVTSLATRNFGIASFTLWNVINNVEEINCTNWVEAQGNILRIKSMLIKQ